MDGSVCSEPPYSDFKFAAQRLLPDTGKTVGVHERCRVSFRTRLAVKETQSENVVKPVAEATDVSPTSETYRPRRESLQKRETCLSATQLHQIMESSLMTEDLVDVQEKMVSRKSNRSLDVKLKNESDMHHGASNRLEILLSGPSYDVFAVDVFYHTLCYYRFTYVYEPHKPLVNTVSPVRTKCTQKELWLHSD